MILETIALIIPMIGLAISVIIMVKKDKLINIKEDANHLPVEPGKPIHEEFAEYEEKQKQELPLESREMLDSLNEKILSQERQINELLKAKDGVSKKVLMGIAQNINITLKTMASLDFIAKDIQENENTMRDALLQLENQGRLDEVKNIKDMALLKFREFFNRIVTEHKMLRNELEQLQSKIRSA